MGMREANAWEWVGGERKRGREATGLALQFRSCVLPSRGILFLASLVQIGRGAGSEERVKLIPLRVESTTIHWKGKRKKRIMHCWRRESATEPLQGVAAAEGKGRQPRPVSRCCRYKLTSAAWFLSPLFWSSDSIVSSAALSPTLNNKPRLRRFSPTFPLKDRRVDPSSLSSLPPLPFPLRVHCIPIFPPPTASLPACLHCSIRVFFCSSTFQKWSAACCTFSLSPRSCVPFPCQPDLSQFNLVFVSFLIKNPHVDPILNTSDKFRKQYTSNLDLQSGGEEEEEEKLHISSVTRNCSCRGVLWPVHPNLFSWKQLTLQLLKLWSSYSLKNSWKSILPVVSISPVAK